MRRILILVMLLAIVIGWAIWFWVISPRPGQNPPPTPVFHPKSQTPVNSELPISHIPFNNAVYTVVDADLKKYRLDLLWKTPAGQRIDTLMNAEKQFQNSTLLFATNSGIFDVKYSPLGLHVQAGKTLSPLNLKTGGGGGGNFYLKPNGVFLFDETSGAQILESSRFGQLKPSPRLALQSGPLLVSGNQIHPSLKPNKTSLYIRSAVAVQSPWQIRFILSEKPVSLHDIAAFCKDKLNCPNALYLDGAISQFYFPGVEPPLQGHFAGILTLSK